MVGLGDEFYLQQKSVDHHAIILTLLFQHDLVDAIRFVGIDSHIRKLPGVTVRIATRL